MRHIQLYWETNADIIKYWNMVLTQISPLRKLWWRNGDDDVMPSRGRTEVLHQHCTLFLFQVSGMRAVRPLKIPCGITSSPHCRKIYSRIERWQQAEPLTVACSSDSLLLRSPAPCRAFAPFHSWLSFHLPDPVCPFRRVSPSWSWTPPSPGCPGNAPAAPPNGQSRWRRWFSLVSCLSV